MNINFSKIEKKIDFMAFVSVTATWKTKNNRKKHKKIVALKKSKNYIFG